MSEDTEAAVEVEEVESQDKPAPKKRGRPKKVAKPEEGQTQVVCIVTTKPWNEEGPMEHGKKYNVSDDVAKLLEEKGLCTIV